MSRAKCIECDKYYVKTSTLGTCVECDDVVSGDQLSCNFFIRKKVDVLPLLNEIASLLTSGQKEVVLLADGGPMFTLSNELNINQTEIILRTYCKPSVKYTIVPLEDE